MARKYFDSLAITNPELAKQWHPTLNGDLRPEHVSRGCITKAFWQCPTGKADHVWDTVISSRAGTQPKCCPFCSGKRIIPSNSLAAFHPAIAKEWHPTLNGDLRPDQVAPMSNKRYWWKCSTGIEDHVWEAITGNRTQHGRGCPFCTGQRVCLSNCLATRFPKIAKEWHPTLNGDLTPYQVVSGSDRKFWWQCPKHKDHAWDSSVPNRQHNGCPTCRESKGEKRVAMVLDNLRLSYKRQFRFKNCKRVKRLPFDFAVATFDRSPGIIEYQGRQHYHAIEKFGGEEGLASTQRNDQIKREFCKSKHLRYLEIPYWRFDDIEPLVEGFVKGLIA